MPSVVLAPAERQIINNNKNIQINTFSDTRNDFIVPKITSKNLGKNASTSVSNGKLASSCPIGFVRNQRGICYKVVITTEKFGLNWFLIFYYFVIFLISFILVALLIKVILKIIRKIKRCRMRRKARDTHRQGCSCNCYIENMKNLKKHGTIDSPKKTENLFAPPRTQEEYININLPISHETEEKVDTQFPSFELLRDDFSQQRGKYLLLK